MRLSMEPRLRFDISWRDLWSIAWGSKTRASDLFEAQDRIRGFWAHGHVTVGLSVRTLFDALLSVLNLPYGSVVVMTAVNVSNMADIARAHGLKLKIVDIDPSTLRPAPGALLNACREYDAKVCVVAQLFGANSPIDDATAMRAHGVLVVEDAAQAFAGEYYKGDPSADLSLFSFGPIKRGTVLAGGVGVFADDVLARKVARHMSAYERRTDRWYRRRACKYLLLKTLSVGPIYNLFVRSLSLFGQDPDEWIGKMARGFNSANIFDAIRFRPPNRLYGILARRLSETHDAETRFRAVKQTLPELTIGRDVQRHAAWLCPIRVQSPAQVRDQLRTFGFDATRGATSLRVLDQHAAPMATQLLREILYLPHPFEMSEGRRLSLKKALTSL